MIRHIRWQFLAISIAAVLLAVLLVRQAMGLTTVLVPAQGGTYVEGLAGQPLYLNPLLNQYNDVDRDLSALIFNGLVGLDQTGKPMPELASSWDVSENGRVYTFHLRNDVRWQDGERFTADDVVFTTKLLQDPGYTGPADTAALWRTVAITRVNESTVQFGLAEPFGPFLDYATIGLLPEHKLHGITADKLRSDPFNLNPIGTGPFAVSQVGTDNGRISQILLETNPLYFGVRPWLSKIQFKFYSDYPSLLTAYEGGEIQGVSQILPQDLHRAWTYPNLNTYSARLPRISMVLLKLDDDQLPFFKDRRVRQALLLGLDRQSLIDQVLYGQGATLDTPVLPGSWAFDPSLARVAPSPSQAAALLDQAGWKLPEGVPQIPRQVLVRRSGNRELAFQLLVVNDPAHVALGQELASQWAKLGVRVTVEPIPPGTTHDRLSSRDFQAILVDLDVPGDPDPYPFWDDAQIDKGQNYSGFRDPEMSKLLEKARLTVEIGARAALYRQFQSLFVRQVPAILLYYPIYTYGLDSKVGGVQIAPFMRPEDRFQTIADWYVVRRRVAANQSQ